MTSRTHCYLIQKERKEMRYCVDKMAENLLAKVTKDGLRNPTRYPGRPSKAGHRCLEADSNEASAIT